MNTYIVGMKKENNKLIEENSKLKEQLKQEKENLKNVQPTITIYNPAKPEQKYQIEEGIQNFINSVYKEIIKISDLNENRQNITIYNPGKTDEKYHTEKEIQDFINGAYQTHLNYVYENSQNITIYDPDNEKRIFHTQNDIQKFINTIYQDYKQKENQMADLQKVLNEAQLYTQNVPTIDIHDPVNNCTVDQKETIQAAIDNISYVSFNKKYN